MDNKEAKLKVLQQVKLNNKEKKAKQKLPYSKPELTIQETLEEITSGIPSPS